MFCNLPVFIKVLLTTRPNSSLYACLCLFSVSRSLNGLASWEFCSSRVCLVMFCNTSSSSCTMFWSWLAMLTHTDLTAVETRVLVLCTMSSTAERLCISLLRKRYAALVLLSWSPGASTSSSSDSGSPAITSPASSSADSIWIFCAKSCGCWMSRATCKIALCLLLIWLL